MKISDSKAVVSGGASGIGEACVRRIVDGGGRVAILDMQDEKGKTLATSMGDSVMYIHADVTDDDGVSQAIDAAATRFSGINVAINCAGIGGPCKVLDAGTGPMSMQFFESRIQVNLIGTMRVLVKVAAKMAENVPNGDGERGVIINTSSVAASQGQIGQAAYSASKAGIEGLMLPVARELGRHGIRVVTIAPGVIDTPMFANIPDKAREALFKAIPFPKRLGRPMEYALLAEHLIENAYLNGEIYKITGALRMA